ncbi:tetratricopeptide repeat protein [Clostridium fungisolvens]|uniref:Beta-barrel assembly-enhancing protease n=1 Tax=Clostridium fungisolvens TaxID=1604897 RepID=A0A6V8SBL2_9CLOT|nr:tetratricopeptide repeat protein [Clostridium fungisolvens]GFP74241.1 Beta-barrel assembly-enhancing protease [Clostridium fungisolvens]
METNELRLEALDLNQQGALLLKAGNIQAAKEKFDKAIEIDPMLMENYKNYGDLHMATQEYREAKSMYKKALLIEKRGELYFLYGNACFMSDDVHEGLEYYNLAITSGYDSDEMLFFMGMAYEYLNDQHMALRYFQKACIKNPSRPDYLIKKITTLVRLNMIDGAEESNDELLKNNPEMYDGYHLKTQLLIHKGELKEAMEFAKAASIRFPQDADLMYDYVKCVALSGELELAYKLIETAKKMKYFEDSKQAFTMLEAQVAAEKNDIERAIACCKECIALENAEYFDGEARFMLMNFYLAQKDYDSALEIATTLITKDQEDSYYYAALYYKPFCLRQLGRVEEAKPLYKEANSIYRLATLENPSAIDIYLYRVMCLKDIEEYDKALELLDFIFGISENIAEVYTLRADVYRSLGKATLAKEELQKAYKLKPDLKNVYEQDGK